MPTPAQLRKIWMSARELGLEEAELRDVAEAVSGARSISGLSFAHARALIDRLVALGATPGAGASKPSGRRTGGGEVKLITGEVRTLIERLREQLGGKWTEERYFAGACQRVIKRPRPRTGAEGARVVEMLKKRLAHERAKEAR